MFDPEQVRAGQAAYTWWNLAIQYDLVVLGYSNSFLWKCPAGALLAHYNKNISANHLDVGVGTGYYLSHCRYPTRTPRLALMDINKNSLARASRRTRHLHPEIHHRNILETVPFDGPGFDSVGMTYLLHCLPGSIEEKAVVFDHVRPLMNPCAILFGATILQRDVPVSPRAQRLMDIYNSKGIFSNTNDTMAGLEKVLKSCFTTYEIVMHGCVAKFVAR